MSIKLNKDKITSLLASYNSDKNNKELEVVYKKQINDDSKNKILSYLSKTYKKPTVKYVINTHIEIISKNHRLVFEYDDNNILEKHCNNEILLNIKQKSDLNEIKQNLDDYKLEYKSLIERIEISELSSFINLKSEYEEIDDTILENFYMNYQKFRKFYRIKKIYSFIIEDKYRVDLSIIKKGTGLNVVSAEFDNILEQYELEIEFISENNIETTDIIKMLQYISIFERINKDSYFIIKDEKKISREYQKLLRTILHNVTDIGPKPIGLTKKTIKNMILNKSVLEDLEVIKDNLLYKITQKADGERYFMFINNTGNIYLINNNNNILETGLKLNVTNPECASFKNSILDGEYIITNKSEYKYMFFDIYIMNNNKCFDKILTDRIKIMTNLNNLLNNDSESKKYNQLFDVCVKCELKQYEDIDKFNKVLQNNYEYNIDGVIFMPMIKLNKISSYTDNKILKYKKIEDNTIDVYVTNNELKCGYNVYLSNNTKEYVLVDLVSIKPYIKDLHKQSIYKNETDMTTDTPIDWKKLNNKVVEIVYLPKYKKFKLNKIRYDKTIQYNQTKKITANNFGIINDIMTNIHDNLTPEDLKDINISTIQDKYLSNSSYYKVDNSKKRNNIRDINNIIKSELINKAINKIEDLYKLSQNETIEEPSKIILENLRNIKVLDIACGRGGDIKKFIDSCFDKKINKEKHIKEQGGIKFLLGIDNDPINIEHFEMNSNSSNNARARFIQFKNNYQHNNDESPDIYKNNSVYYISGDLNNYNPSKNLQYNYEKYITNLENKDFIDRNKYDKELLEDITSDVNIYNNNEFELINCQMAIHYFCTSSEKLKNFTHYISENLKTLGLFICTFMEKDNVIKLFDNINVKNTVSTSILNGKAEPNNNDFWILQKMDEEFNEINVKFETLQDDFKSEPLITESDLINAFEEHNICPIDIVDFKNHDKLKNIHNDNNLEFSKLYKYIIFQKQLDKDHKLGVLQNFVSDCLSK